jgi:hypothetical protein
MASPIATYSSASRPQMTFAIFPLTAFDGCAHALAAVTRLVAVTQSTASWAPVDAPEGTAAQRFVPSRR